MNDPTYIQAVPLYTKEDDEAFKYFRDHLPEIAALAGEHIKLMVPETVLTGDGKDVYTAPGSDRYKGLRTSDLPCLWIEDSEKYAFALRLPAQKADIVRLMRNLKDASEKATNAKEIREALLKTEESAIPVSDRGFYVNAAAGSFLATLILLGVALWFIPRISAYQFGAPVFLIYLVASVIPALLLFGAMRSYGTLKGKRLGVVFEFGGPAALSVLLLLLGLWFERSAPARTISFSVFCYVAPNQNQIVPKDGKLILILDRREVWPINQGEALPRDIPSKWTGQEVPVSIEIDGYETAQSTLRIDPQARIFLPMKPAQDPTPK